jgi:tRNA (guanine37-N1)-methyltransferase
MMRCDFISTFPSLLEAVLQESILKRAQEKGLLQVRMFNIRDYTEDRYRTTDDSPYGGGAGMVMKPEPIFRVVDQLMEGGEPTRIIMPTPQGTSYSQEKAVELSQEGRRLIFICGHYEGIDERVRLGLPVEELSIGDYVLTGGELASLVIVDAAVRLIPGVLGDTQSAERDSFMNALLDFPHYTRPVEIRGLSVPEVLLSGDHEAIRRWRKKQAVLNTLRKRPDLLEGRLLDEEEKRFLEEIQREERQGQRQRSVC